MIKYHMRLLLALLFSTSAFAVTPSKPLDQCKQHLPYGTPSSAKADVTDICRPGYALRHDNTAKIPVWVAYRITPQSAIGCEERAGAFKADPDLQQGRRSTSRDYAKSGYDIGHMANSADMRSSDQLSEDSNVTSNAAPQLPGLNRAAWKSLEVRTRSWVIGRGHPILVYVGPIYKLKGAKVIGRNEVVVPDAFYKVLVDTKTADVLAFIYPHEASTATPGAFQSSIPEVQRRTGIVLPLPKDAVKSELWPITASGMSAKATSCPTK